MSKIPSAFNESNLAIMGLYDVVYEVYTNLKSIYCSVIDQLDITKTAFFFKIDDMCRSRVRKILESFVSGYTGIFTDEYERIHINSFGLNRFSMLNSKQVTPWQSSIVIITFHTFLKKLLDVVVRIIAQRRNRQYPGNEEDRVREDVNGHIQSIVSQYQNRIFIDVDQREICDDSNLYVYSQFSLVSCNQKNHTVVSDMYCAEKLDGSGFYRLPIHRCATCGRKFVGKYTLDYYQEQFGNIYVIVRKDLAADAFGSYEGLNSETELHARGYNVAEKGMSEKERRMFLIRLIETGEMTYFEISRDIKTAIHTQQNLPLHSAAVAKWKSDLAFLSEFIENHSEFA